MDAFAIIILVFFAILIISFIRQGLKIVKQAETIVVERLGRYHRTLQSGVNLIIPIIDKPREIEWRYQSVQPDGSVYIRRRILQRIDLREAVYDFPRQNVITKDNVMTQINAILYFQILDPSKVVYEIANLPDALEKLTQTTLRNVIGELDLDETLSSRDTINNKLRLILDEASEKWGVKVNRVELQDINPPTDIQTAMEKQMRAERDRRAAVLEAEGSKSAAILEAEGIRQAEINKAEGEKQSKILRAEGEGQARLRVAQAEAEAIKVVSESIARSKTDPATYLIAMRYIDAYKEMLSGKDGKVVLMPYEASGLLSSIGGIKEMLSGMATK